ncbi:hypothetical protein CH296_27875, partial [Rhodococcus sp. 14-2496-1d]|uniref:hypothetical protein n=1 Tax=Rhodococcus sp. 14-2496-1d TaxID=2023146 RepID=UPI000BD46F42
MARAIVTVDDDSNLPTSVKAKVLADVKADADTRYAPQFPAATVIVTDPATGNVTRVTTNGVV